MPTERCWRCHQVKRGVELCPSDDRLCPDCYRDNERQLTKRPPSSDDVDAATSHESSSLADGTTVNINVVPVSGGDGKKLRSRSTKASKNKSEAPAVPPSTQSDENNVIRYGTDQPPALPAVDHTEELSQLRQLVSSQQILIKKLQGQLNFVLSFLGITETFAESICDGNLPRAVDVLQSEPQDNNIDHSVHGEVNDQASWSVVARRRHDHRQDTPPCNTFQQSVVAAVYVDQSVKKRRETSIIVTGLAPTVTTPDSELFTTLCSTEFHFHPNIASTKRLGRVMEGRIQPLLVYLKQSEQAKQLVASAKQLRRSSDPVTKEKVFINPNLTRAEAAAAYQVRVQRRSVLQRRNERFTGANGSVTRSSNTNNLPQTDHTDRPLNPNADSFNPAPVPTAGRAA